MIAAIVAGCWFVFGRGDNTRTVHADFAFVNGLYQGSTVTVLGVPVGHINQVDARGDHVRLTMRVRDDVTLPADVEAFVLNPSVISDRHLELGPAYTKGKKFADGGVIPMERTHSPISWDKLMESVKTLTQVMGPGDGSTGSQTADSGAGRTTEPDGEVVEAGARIRYGYVHSRIGVGVFGARADDMRT